MTEQGRYVRYACYGSNLNLSRFLRYIDGDEPGTPHGHVGSRDKRHPLRADQLTLPYELYFAGRAERWGGDGVAFLDPHRSGHVTHARAYWLHPQQFLDVFAQENGLPPGGFDHLDLASYTTPGEYDIDPTRPYGRLIALDGSSVPTFTFTRPTRLEPRRRPSWDYLTTIVQGLQVSWRELGFDALRAYLLERTGWSEDELRDCVFQRERRSGFFEVGRTGLRRRGRNEFIAQLSHEEMRTLDVGPGGRVRLDVYQQELGRKRVDRNVSSVVGLVDDADHDVPPGVVQADQKLRTAIGARPGDWVRVTRMPDSEGVTLRRHLRELIRTQPQLMRVRKATHGDMEIDVCRIPAQEFELLAIEPGDYVRVASFGKPRSVKALPIPEKELEYRQTATLRDDVAREHAEDVIYPDAMRRLRLDRLGDERLDIPWIFLDEYQRQRLDVDVLDAVRVWRDPWHQLLKRGYVVTIPLMLGAVLAITELRAVSENTAVALVVGCTGLVTVGLLTLWALRNGLTR